MDITTRKTYIKKVAVIWKKDKSEGTVEVVNGRLLTIYPVPKTGSTKRGSFRIRCSPCRLTLEVEGFTDRITEGATRVMVDNPDGPFTFNLDDIHKDYPVYIPAYGVAVTQAEDPRSYEEIEKGILDRGLKNEQGILNEAEEESYEKAAEGTWNLKCVTWLGLSRDARIFQVGFRGEVNKEKRVYDYITPKFHAFGVKIPEQENECTFSLMTGRGFGCEDHVRRWLDEGYLPILRAEIKDGNIAYGITTFTALEKSDFTPENLRGTHWIAADGQAHGHMFTDEQQAYHDRIAITELQGEEQVILFYRIEAVNHSDMPDYAHFCAPVPSHRVGMLEGTEYRYDEAKGYGRYHTGRVFSIAKIDGEVSRKPEFSVFLKPGEKAVFDFCIPHSPLDDVDADLLRQVDFDARYQQCKDFWKKKLSMGAQIKLPEKRIDEMVKAGICHIETVAYGNEPDGSITPTTGIYSAIGSESAPIMLFMDYMGYHDIARRMIQFFFDKQHADGLIQNFAHYMVETGPVLWCAGEHYRITKDTVWAQKISGNLIRGCDYFIRWMDNNKLEKYKGKGYGLLDGRVGDPEDPYHSFMLNGYAYLGMNRAVEVLEAISHQDAPRIKIATETFREAIRESFLNNLKKGSAVPLGDGSWCPTAAPWPENCSPLTFHIEDGRWITHGGLVNRDALNGPLYLVLHEVLDAQEPAARFLMDFHMRYMCMRNVSFAQPYYARHDWVHVLRGDVKAFIKLYYNGFVGISDRETYTFWEHYFHASPHKTHEEAWFLLQTRWMLYLEDGNSLRITPAIPRAWLRDGNILDVKGVASYFGRLDFIIKSHVDKGFIEAEVQCERGRHPDEIRIRLPHPQRLIAMHCEGAIYDPDSETAVIRGFNGYAKIQLMFEPDGQRSNGPPKRR